MKYLFLFVVLFSACLSSDNLEDSICVDRCITIEGTILNNVTNEPYAGLKLRAFYAGVFMEKTGRFNKAKVETDANGFYSLSFEVFDEELNAGGRFYVSIEDVNKVYWRNDNIHTFIRRGDQLDFDNTYTADFILPEPAFVKYDIDGLVNLEENENVRLTVEFEMNIVRGILLSSVGEYFGEHQTVDKGELKVPAGIPLKIKTTLSNSVTMESRILEEEEVMLGHNEKYDVEVDI